MGWKNIVGKTKNREIDERFKKRRIERMERERLFQELVRKKTHPQNKSHQLRKMEREKKERWIINEIKKSILKNTKSE